MIGRGKRLVIGGVLATSSLAACGSDDSAADRTVRLAVTDLQGLEELQREFGTFVTVLEEKSGLEIEFFPVNDRTAAAAALSTDQVDLVFTGPAEYVVINARTGAAPIVAINRANYRSCIYTTTDSGISEVADLAGGTIGMSDIGSTSGHLGPSQLLLDAGLDPQEDLKVLTIGDTVHEALKRGDIDAVGVGCHDYDEFMEADDPDNYRVLVEGEQLPPDLIMGRQGLDAEIVDVVRRTFVDHFDVLLPAMLEGSDNAKFDGAEITVVADADYDVVRSMYRAIGVDEFSEFVGT